MISMVLHQMLRKTTVFSTKRKKKPSIITHSGTWSSLHTSQNLCSRDTSLLLIEDSSTLRNAWRDLQRNSSNPNKSSSMRENVYFLFVFWINSFIFELSHQEKNTAARPRRDFDPHVPAQREPRTCGARADGQREQNFGKFIENHSFFIHILLIF